MVFDAFMLPYGYLFERREGVMAVGNKILYVFIICLVVKTNTFLLK